MAEAPARGMPANPSGLAYLQKLNAVQQVATDILSRIGKILEENPGAIVDKQTAMLPREQEDKQKYFLEKIARAHRTLNELAGLLQTTSQGASPHDQIREELKVLFVLIESFRPERMVESGLDPGERVQEAIRERVQSLALDIINMRERLK